MSCNVIYTKERKESEYREQSHNPRMAGVTHFPWRCKVCKKNKPIGGRKSLGKGKGFKCADCASAST